jgi:hypothetical protein
MTTYPGKMFDAPEWKMPFETVERSVFRVVILRDALGGREGTRTKTKKASE